MKGTLNRAKCIETAKQQLIDGLPTRLLAEQLKTNSIELKHLKVTTIRARLDELVTTFTEEERYLRFENIAKLRLKKKKLGTRSINRLRGVVVGEGSKYQLLTQKLLTIVDEEKRRGVLTREGAEIMRETVLCIERFSHARRKILDKVEQVGGYCHI